jgi:PPOX class probable F420-dependent enzyme
VENLPRAVKELLDEAVPAIVATTNIAGTPQASVVWIERRGNDISFFSDSSSVKLRNLSHQGSVVLLVLDPRRVLEPGAPCYVRISGTASLEPMKDTEFCDRLARRYMGIDRFPHSGEYVKVTIASTSWSGVGPFPGTVHDWGD